MWRVGLLFSDMMVARSVGTEIMVGFYVPVDDAEEEVADRGLDEKRSGGSAPLLYGWNAVMERASELSKLGANLEQTSDLLRSLLQSSTSESAYIGWIGRRTPHGTVSDSEHSSRQRSWRCPSGD